MAGRRSAAVAALSRHLQEKLGPEAAQDIAAALEASVAGVKDQVMELVVERLERRIAEMKAELRQDIARVDSRITEAKAELCQEIAEMKAELRQEIAKMRADLIKWMFIFWVTQMTAFAGLAALVLRR